MSIRTGVVVAISFQEIDCAPDTKTCTKSNHESLKNTYCAVKKFHYNFLLEFVRHTGYVW